MLAARIGARALQRFQTHAGKYQATHRNLPGGVYGIGWNAMPHLTMARYQFSSRKPNNNNNNKFTLPQNIKNILKKIGEPLQNYLDTAIKFLNQWSRTIYHYELPRTSVLLLIVFAYWLFREDKTTELNEHEIMERIADGSVKDIVLEEQQFFQSQKNRIKKVQGVLYGTPIQAYVLDFEKVIACCLEHKVPFEVSRKETYKQIFKKLYEYIDLFSLILFIFILKKSIRRSEQANVGRMRNFGMENKTKKFQKIENVSVRFKDVAGLEESKRQVTEVVDFLRYPEKYLALGATIPKGILLTGPPGTGKTLLAKACAGEAGVPFYSVSGSDFVEVYVGIGASRVRDLFKAAKSSSPSIIFIDELDAVGKKRQNKMGSNDERESTLNQLLVEMDGFDTDNKVIVMGATNRKEILDDALVRPGRFDREVEVGLPDLKGRFQIFLVHLRPLVLSPKYTKQQYARRLASLSPGFSGAEIANLCNEAAILAARHQKPFVQMLDFETSSERVLGGVQRKGFVSLKEKRVVSFHECGHAVVSWFLEGASPLLKVSIVPRSKGALGFAQYFLNENQLQSRQELIDQICFILGGRCAELHFFNQVTTGAYDDLSKAYNIAYYLVAKLGMSKQVGFVGFPDIQYTKPYGEYTESAIDREIQAIIKECTEKTVKMVAQYAALIERLAQQLLVLETMDARQIQAILGPRPFKPNPTFAAYFQTS